MAVVCMKWFTLTIKGQCTDWTATHTILILENTPMKWHGNEDEVGIYSSKRAYNNFLLKPPNLGHNLSVKFHNLCIKQNHYQI